jgi:hypothetical protein
LVQNAEALGFETDRIVRAHTKCERGNSELIAKTAPPKSSAAPIGDAGSVAGLNGDTGSRDIERANSAG